MFSSIEVVRQLMEYDASNEADRLPPDLREAGQSVERPFSDHQLLDVGHALVEVAAPEEILADELAPLVVGRVEDAAHRGLAGGGEGRVGEGEVQAGSDLGGPPVLHLPPHDLPAGAEPVQAQEPRRRPLPRRPDVVPLLAAER